MNTKHGTVAHVRVIGRCALTGVLAAMLATQGFAQGATGVTTNAVPTAPVTQAADNNTAASLPDAPVVMASSSAEPSNGAMKADEASGAVTSTTPKKHKVKAGWLALGILGTASLGMGSYFYALNTKNTSGKMIVGSIFAVPGAAAAGFGFYYAFK